MADGRHIVKRRRFGHNSTTYCPIFRKFCTLTRNPPIITINCHKCQTMKI